MKKFIYCVLFTVFFLAGSALAEQGYLRLATFNIAELGEGSHPDTRDEQAIAKMLVNLDLDLIAVQEVGTRQSGEDQVRAIVRHMNSLLSSGACVYSCLTSTQETGDERYAFIWRSPALMLSGPRKMADTAAYKGSSFVRTPVFCSFKAGNFDFVLMNVHLYTRIDNPDPANPRGRKFEYEQLVKWLKHNVQAGAEKDYIIVGDWNRFLDGSAYPRDSAWSVITYPGFENDYRFPLLEALPGRDYHAAYAPSDEWSTTQTKSRSMYDQVLISAGAYREFGTVEEGLDARFGENVGIEDFDNWEEYKGMEWRELKYVISDHRPVWVRFRVDMGG